MSFLKAFIAPSRTGDAWFFAGFTSSYPNITNSGSTVLSNRLPCKGNDIPGCKVFRVPTINSSLVAEVKLEDVVLAELSEQVLVFQFQSEFHAVDHSCPHSLSPLSQATPFDIEDFGVRLSAGLKCPKHDWSFDLFRGNGDRGNYRLKIWEVQLRPFVGLKTEGEGVGEEVWVRRKQKIG